MKVQTSLPIIFLLLIVACTNHEHADKQIFRYNESAGIATLDPAFAKDQSIIWPCRQLYNGLVQLATSDADSAVSMQVLPAIAHRWEVSPDGKHYTFFLRPDVHFHRNPLFGTSDSTRSVVASDFVYSFSRITDPTIASPGAWILSNVKNFEAINDTTFTITLKQPFAPFLSMLAMVYCSVVPHEVVEHYGKEFRSHPCGTGPFHFQYWKEGVKLVLRRNNDYFERDDDGNPLPYIDAVATTFIIDRQTVFLEFIKGELDFMNSLDASYKDEILNPNGTLKTKYANKINLHSTPYLNTEYLGFNLAEPQGPLADKRVRQAINYGFDRQKMMQYLRNNIGTPGEHGFVPLGLPGFAPADSLPLTFSYNPGKARQLLSEAGYPNGEGLPRLKLSTTANYLDLCKYMQQQLGLLGIDVQIDVNPPAALREQIAQGKSSWFRGSWVADYPDAENYLSLFYSPNRAPAGPNYTRYNNPAFDNLYTTARSETDESRRTTLYRQMDSLVMTDAPVVVLYYDQILHFTHKNISGLRSDATNTLDLRRVRIAN